MNHVEQRQKLRAVLNGTKCPSPASVYDPLSARVAETIGYEIAQVGGLAVANAVIGAPDLNVLTLTEYADQIRRITRVSRLSLLIDADHGYGNALNVMRTVEEFEHAGAAGLTIEDTALPLAFGQARGAARFISVEEGAGKMRAAVAARADPSLVIGARTSALKVEGIEGTLARVRAYAQTGVDAIFLEGLEKLEHLKAIHAAAKLPIIVGNNRGGIKREDLAANGARLLFQGQLPLWGSVKGLEDVFTHLFNGGAPADLKAQIVSRDRMDELVHGGNYQQWLSGYMH